MVNAVPSLGAATVDAVRRLILAAAAIGVLFALLTASLLARSFSRPIRNLVEAVEGSDDDARLDLPSDVGGEIGVLARALQASRARSSEGIRALRTQEARFRTLFEASPSALLLIDASHRIALVNTRTEGLFGYARQELIGQPLDLLVPVERRAAHREHMAAYAGHPVARDMGANLELHGLRKDGGTVPIAVGLSPLAGPDGRQTLAAVIDVTERKGYEDKLRRSNQELAQFAYVAAHDLREPLRIIASYSELLARRYQESLDERARRYIDYLVTEAKRMQGLITDLLAYSRLESQGQPPSRVVTDVELAAVLHTLQPLIVRVAATLHAGPLPDVLADATQLRMLLQNLLNNALVYHGSEPPRIEISAEQQGRQVRFAVRDNGVGIGAEHAERVFQMFQRLGPKTADAGSGIGLALVKRIVERHGGQVWFESEVGQGTTFYFTLEAAPQDAD